MVNKIFGVKNITHLLYGIIVLLPMMAILGRVCYTVANKNAKDSYSADNQIVEQLPISTPSVLISGVNYNVQLHNSSNRQNSYIIKYTYCSMIDDLLEKYPSYTDLLFCTEFLFRDGATEEGNFISFRMSGQYVTHSTFTYEQLPTYSFIFTCDGVTPSSLQNTFNANTIYQNVLVDNSTLDNAFEYSLKTFIDDNNLGEVDMFSWFTDLFLDNSNVHNQIYIGFVNWYLNYTMLVSCGYLFFLVLIWFINFIRRILDKSMYQDYGGF